MRFIIFCGVGLVLGAVPFFASAQFTIVPQCGMGNLPPCEFCHFVQLADNIIQFLITIAAIIGALMFAWAGFLMVTARGNVSQVEKGKGIFLNVVIGLVILLTSWLIVDTVMKTLAGSQAYGMWRDIQCVSQPTYGNTAQLVTGTVPAPTGNRVIQYINPETGEATTVTGGTLSSERTIEALEAAGIKIWESAPGRTSLTGMQAVVTQEVLNLRYGCNCALTITGGTESGHAGGEYSHSSGYKVDIDDTSVINNYIQSRYTPAGVRSDGAQLYKNGCTTYAKESDHWDIQVRPSC